MQKSLPPSRIIKIQNAHDRETALTDIQYSQLNEDMQEELSQIATISRMKIVRNGEERLGAEVGSVFVEFDDKQ